MANRKGQNSTLSYTACDRKWTSYRRIPHNSTAILADYQNSRWQPKPEVVIIYGPTVATVRFQRLLACCHQWWNQRNQLFTSSLSVRNQNGCHEFCLPSHSHTVVNGRGQNSPLTTPTPLNWQLPNIAHVTMSTISAHKSHLVKIMQGVTSPHIAKVINQFFSLFLSLFVRKIFPRI